MRVAFFTAGTLGAGHFTRGLAIGRALVRAGFSGSYRMFGARGERSSSILDERAWTLVPIDEAELRSPARARGSRLALTLQAFDPDVLVVDMFWAPLRHIMPLRAEAWLLVRWSPPTWLVGPPGLPFDPLLFSRIVTIEPLSISTGTHAIDPVVIANPDERRPSGALRDKLGVSRDERLVGVVHAGLEGEREVLGQAAEQEGEGRVVYFDAYDPDPLFPIAPWLGDCDRIFASAGYNTFWEARWLNYFGRVTFRPFERRNDHHDWRLSRGARYPMRSNGADTIAQWIMRG